MVIVHHYVTQLHKPDSAKIFYYVFFYVLYYRFLGFSQLKAQRSYEYSSDRLVWSNNQCLSGGPGSLTSGLASPYKQTNCILMTADVNDQVLE